MITYQNRSLSDASLRLVGARLRRAGRRPLVIAAVHFLFHGLVQTLAGVIGDLQKAAGLHHNIRLARVGHDGELRNDLETHDT